MDKQHATVLQSQSEAAETPQRRALNILEICEEIVAHEPEDTDPNHNQHVEPWQRLTLTPDPTSLESLSLTGRGFEADAGSAILKKVASFEQLKELELVDLGLSAAQLGELTGHLNNLSILVIDANRRNRVDTPSSELLALGLFPCLEHLELSGPPDKITDFAEHDDLHDLCVRIGSHFRATGMLKQLDLYSQDDDVSSVGNSWPQLQSLELYWRPAPLLVDRSHTLNLPTLALFARRCPLIRSLKLARVHIASVEDPYVEDTEPHNLQTLSLMDSWLICNYPEQVVNSLDRLFPQCEVCISPSGSRWKGVRAIIRELQAAREEAENVEGDLELPVGIITDTGGTYNYEL
ncbi:hypothetical protein POSPLADRAFT_1047562 [Postia placenta MAD-698-R-SB12]|uniref:Uncharacterized protein n=1 Tax=Postia placenta MAD-698-R-SB12 TaxID=670580 RepID=A0A1X6MYB2_9APHY|nr:hypothetical protein POSPLADRAFT_1047562 [Postia placenta MAD-698-R-SB12]OSX61349.1 hypothetical protein POSPLADRAFT_1047562 [Postia placenta MAD-698-R-SB12]